jgi:hypothetical protein
MVSVRCCGCRDSRRRPLMFGNNPAGRHMPQAQSHAKPASDVCPECKGAKYIGPILGLMPCPRGCAEVKKDDEVWTEQERLERLSRNERGRVK